MAAASLHLESPDLTQMLELYRQLSYINPQDYLSQSNFLALMTICVYTHTHTHTHTHTYIYRGEENATNSSILPGKFHGQRSLGDYSW